MSYDSVFGQGSMAPEAFPTTAAALAEVRRLASRFARKPGDS